MISTVTNLTLRIISIAIILLGTNLTALNFTDIFTSLPFAKGQECTNPPSGLVSWWPGDGNANDLEGNNHGFLEHGAMISPVGKVAEAFDLDGVDDQVRIGNPTNLRITGSLTIDAWIMVTRDIQAGVASDHGVILSKWGQDVAADAYIFGLAKPAGTQQIQLGGGIGDGQTPEDGLTGGVIPVFTWKHVAMTYDASTLDHKLYIDGQQVASGTRGDGSIPASNLNVFIGREDSAVTRYFPGKIDELEIFNRALSQGEIQEIFDAGIAGKCKKGDLSVKSVIPVQAPNNPDMLVWGKPIILNTTFVSTFEEVARSVDITIRTDEETIAIADVDIGPGEDTLYLPFDRPLTPLGDSFIATVNIALNPEDHGPSETRTDNNFGHTVELPVKKTNDLSVLYVNLSFTGDTKPPPTCAETNIIKDASEQYIEGSYPITSNSIHEVDCSSFAPLKIDQPPFGQKISDREYLRIFIHLDRSIWCITPNLCLRNGNDQPFDHVVGVLRESWHRDFVRSNFVGSAWSLKVSASLGSASPKSVLVEETQTSGVSTAHEIGHTYGFSNDVTGLRAPGVWVDKRMVTVDNVQDPTVQRFPNGVNTGNFMQPGSRLIVDRWITLDQFDFLLNALKFPGPDPGVIGISGIISKDGTAEFDKLERFLDVVDIPLNNSGDYTVEYFDSTNNKLAETGFNVSFSIPDLQDKELNVAPFVARIPDVEGTEKLVLKKGEQVLAESTFKGGSGDNDSNAPVISIPNNTVVGAATAEGAQITYTVDVKDDVDGIATLGADGTTITQDDIGGNITLSCIPTSGTTFTTGTTTIKCTATDAAGNSTTASFILTIRDVKKVFPYW